MAHVSLVQGMRQWLGMAFGALSCACVSVSPSSASSRGLVSDRSTKTTEAEASAVDSPPTAPSDLQRRSEGWRSNVDLALEASGLSEGPPLETARRRLESVVASVVDRVRRSAPSTGESDDAYQVGRRLLAALHEEGGPLRVYDARATTLAEILDGGRFNCVSASVLFNLVARRLDLNVGAELLPTHARSLLFLPPTSDSRRRTVVVETTSPLGFDPDERQLFMILEGVAVPAALARVEAPEGGAGAGDPKESGLERRTMITSGGVRVKTRVLIGTIYINRASIAQEAGDLALAERLFARSETFAKAGAMQQVLRDQRAVLLSQLAADDVLSGAPARIERALATLIDAAALAPKAPRILRAVHQNLRAAAERCIASAADRGDERALDHVLKKVLAVGMPTEVAAALRAFAASETARLLAARQDYEGALRVVEIGLQERLSQGDEPLRGTLRRNQVAILRLMATGFARHGAFAAAWHHLRLIDDISGLSKETREVVDEDRRRIVHVAAERLIESNDLEHAAEVYRTGLRRFPKVEVYRHNLIAVLERLAAPIVSGPGCLEAAPILDEIRALDRHNTFPTRSQVHCLLARAEERLRAKDFDEAVALVERARERAPHDGIVLKNLAVVLLRTARMLPRPRGCKRARMLLRQARLLKVEEVPKEAFIEATFGCP
ncbi:MAG: hypothetical protein IPK13_09190 [Deltaproteobacteria bacterium]|nr:hypothetical protein [Deltaproteobacteria bacterium]